MALRTFKQLQSRIAQLGTNILPAVNVAGDYPPAASDLVRAYVLLAHAEIESFLEDIALDFINLAEKKSSETYCTPAISRLLLYAKHDKALPTKALIEDVVAAYRNKISANHGIKGENVLGLFLPLGFSHTDFSQSVLISLDAFGKKRGDYAHRSEAHFKTTQPPDPVSTKSDVEGILSEIENISKLLRNLK